MNTSPGNDGSRAAALDWFVRRRDQGFGAQEEQAFQAWLAADAGNRAAFEHWQQEWQAFDAIPVEMRQLLQRNLAYDRAMEAASADGAPGAAVSPSPSLPRRRRALLPALAMAAFAVATGGSSVLAWGYWQAQPLMVQAYSTARGQQADVPLPDGSRLRLDTATRVEVRYYRHRREVTLFDGQAMFAVQKDAGRPFRVSAGPLHVTVVGTRFAVRHTPAVAGDEGVQVAVEQGRVRVENVTAKSFDHAVLLTAGQQVSSTAHGVSAVSQLAGVDVAPWRAYRVSFDNQRLDRALAELARYGAVPLEIRDARVAALNITGVFDPRDLATFERVLPLSLPVRLLPLAGGGMEVALKP